MWCFGKEQKQWKNGECGGHEDEEFFLADFFDKIASDEGADCGEDGKD